MNLKFIYKIIDNDEWLKAKEKGLYSGSKKDLKDGYIHFSEQDQINKTLNRFFKNQKDLVLLKVDSQKLDHLLWEQASDGSFFPHLYSNLDIQSVVLEKPILTNDDGFYDLLLDF